MSRSLLITGATGKQGGAVIDQLLKTSATTTNNNNNSNDDFVILAITRDPTSASAQRLAAKSPSIKLVKGDLESAPALFEAAKAASPTQTIWGVYSVQALNPKGTETPETAAETKQGKALIDEAIKAGVSYFVYSSVDRGGEKRSWENPTLVPHFQTKHLIEQHLRDASAANGNKMGWTVLRPVAFMDNLEPGFFSKVFLTTLRDTLKDKPLQWVAVSDIGFFGAQAFRDPATWNHRAISIAGDSLTFNQLSDTFKRATGTPAGTTFGFFGSALRMASKEMRLMSDWFRDEGYEANVPELRRMNPALMDMETWLKTKSGFVKRN